MNLAKYQNSLSFFSSIYIARAATYCYMVRFNSLLVCAKCRYCNTLRNNVSVLDISNLPLAQKLFFHYWIQPYTFIHVMTTDYSWLNLDTAMPHADINDFPNACTYAVACKNTNTSACASIIIICYRKRLVSLFAKFFSVNALQ